MNISRTFHFAHSQQAMVLPIVLVLLLVMAIGSVAIVGQISSQTRMASNASNEQMSLQLAEATLRVATNELQSGNFPEPSFHANASGLFCNMPSCGLQTVAPWTVTANWTNAISPNPEPAIPPGSGLNPQFIIEELPPVYPKGTSQTPSRPVQIYRITARVIGQGSQSEVMLQTLFQKAF